MTFGERLTQLRKENGFNTRSEFAEKLGIPSTTLRNYETDVREPGHTFLKQVAEILGVSVDYLLGLKDEKEKTKALELKTSEITHIKKYRALDGHGKEVVDVVLDKETERMQTLAQQAEDEDDEDDVIDVDFASLKASAGNGFQLFDDCPSDKLKVLYNEKTRQADICIQVSGHSMEPVFNDGDILLVRKQPSVNVGEYGIWIINGDTGYVKKNGPDRLISVNDEYDDIYPGEFDEIRCYGKVIGVLDKNWIVE